MRILALDVEAFGPFRDRQRLDFARAASGGLLLITGPTGAGKSSLLDAICFALYNSVPRYDGQIGRVRSDHARPDQATRVVLEFEMGEDRYRVERTPDWDRPSKRKTKRGDGMTTEPGTARLWRWNGGEWEGIAARPREVGAELLRVIGLQREQFLQVVLLAQGGFQRFLRAGDDERQATLRSLFRTQRFDRVERLLVDRRRELEQGVGQRDARIDSLLDQAEEAARDAETGDHGGGAETGSPTAAAHDAGIGEAASHPERRPAREARRDAVAAALDRLEERARALAGAERATETERVAAEERARATRTLAAAQQRLADARARERELAQRGNAIEADRARVQLAERASRMRDHLDRSDRAAARQAEADEAVARAMATIAGARRPEALAGAAAAVVDGASGAEGAITEGSSRSGDVAVRRSGAVAAATLQSERDDLGEAIALLRESAKREASRGTLVDEQQELLAALAAATAAHEEAVQRAAALPALIDEARTASETAALAAAGLEAQTVAVARAEQRLAAARRLAELTPRYDAAQRESSRCADAAASASAVVSDLLARRLAGMAGELASELAPGAPCAVCGSTEHPAPATQHDPVDAGRISEAEAERDAAQRELDRARGAEQELAQAHVAARTAADGFDLGAAEQALSAAKELRDAAQRAEHDRDALRAELDRLQRELAGAADAERVAGQRVLGLQHAAETAAEQLAELDAALASARGGFDRVATRLAASEALHTALGEAIAAIADRDAAIEAHRSAAGELSRALAQCDFAGVAEARAAALPAPERRALAARVASHDAAVQENRGVLAEETLQGLPADPAPLEAHEQLARDAAARARAAAAEAAAVAARLVERRAQLARVDREIAEAAEGGEALMRLRRLADTVQGKDPNTRRMRLEVFVLAARLEAIVEAANRRLARMVGGRYRLQHDDGLHARGRQSGLGLAVLDEYTGRTRSTDSLSGGETFLASLSLALGLADVVTAESGGIRLDTLFIDEGFGTLDPDALDQALATLDALREGGRTVALISHVAELKERLPARLEVLVDDRGVSRIGGQGVLESTANDTDPTEDA